MKRVRAPACPVCESRNTKYYTINNFYYCSDCDQQFRIRGDLVILLTDSGEEII